MPVTDGREGVTRLLLIEDNDGDVFLLSMALRNAEFPHTLITIQDGADAMEFLKALPLSNQSPPDLILLDLNLPRVDGATIIDFLRSDRDLQDIPVILLSSSRAPLDAARVADIKKSTFIAKPSNLEEYMDIGHRVRDFLRQTDEPAAVSGA